MLRFNKTTTTILSTLVTLLISTTDTGNTPFHLACYLGKFHNVKILLKNSKKHNINIYSKNNNGMDGQDLAEYEGRTKIVKLIKYWKHRNKP